MIALRPPSEVMRLSRLGASHQTRLSFMRVLLRGLHNGGWATKRTLWDIDAQGVGRAVYRIQGEGQTLSLVAFAHDLPDTERSDRVIAEAWDATFALFDGEPTPADLERLAANVPLQEAGRVSDRELVLSRANRSVRLWDHVVGRLARGLQPDHDKIAAVGYLMRTTAVYGSGKFGAADRAALSGRPLLDGPFRAEMLAVWLIRTFAVDLVEHMAAAKGGEGAARIAPELRRCIGIGNATGLGMAPFLVNHPVLLHAWISARETAFARVRALPSADARTIDALFGQLERMRVLLKHWETSHPLQKQKRADLLRDTQRLAKHLQIGQMYTRRPWAQLWDWCARNLSIEGQEYAVSLMLEPHGALIDDLPGQMGADELSTHRINGRMTLGQLRQILTSQFDWAIATDFAESHANARFWYVSEAKLEPRLGARDEDDGAARELPLDVARSIAALWANIQDADADTDVAAFLLDHPHHRFAVRRAQIAAQAPYSEIRDNLIAADLMPLNMLRCKLAFFGATRFDPKSDRWLRITMFQNAPFPDELHSMPADDWVLPSLDPLAA